MTAIAQEWAARDVKVADVERELASLREDATDLRTSVMTHIAWVPREWREAARETLAGLAERHPSRTILLFPEPGGDRDTIDAAVSLECFTLPGLDRCVCTEVVELRLLGDRSEAPATVVLPLLLPDLPVFLRWRGRPPFGDAPFDGLVDVVDRLVVDSSEWPDVPSAHRDLVPYFERAVVSDIAWARTLEWRRALARAWPNLSSRISGPRAEAALVAGWLRSRAGLDVAIADADTLPVAAEEDPSELLSRELDRFVRDRVYEAAVAAAA